MKKRSQHQQSKQKVQQDVQDRDRAMLESVLDSFPHSVEVFRAIRNADGTIVDFTWVMNNRNAMLQNGDLTGKTVLQQNPGAVKDGLFDKFVQVTETGIPIDHEVKYRRGQFDGWYRQQLVKMDDGFVMTTEAITAGKKADAELMVNADQLPHIWETSPKPTGHSSGTDPVAQGTEDLASSLAEKARALDALQSSEEKFRTLFAQMDEGFAIIALEHNSEGKLADMLYVEANPAFQQHTGLADPTGRRTSELMPNLEDGIKAMIQRVADTGEPERAETFKADLGRWFDVVYMRIGGKGSMQVAALFKDITERRRQEEHQAFLLRLNDTLRPLTNSEEIQFAAATILGEQLGANRVAYAEHLPDGESFAVSRNYVQGAQQLEGRYRYADYGSDLLAELAAGRNHIQSDLRNDQRLTAVERQAFADAGVGASLNLPLIKGGTLVAFIGVNYAIPHEFTAHEIKLIEEVAERTWAAVERAKAEDALRRSEEKYRTLFNSIDEGFSIIELVFDEHGKVIDYRHLEDNPGFDKLTGFNDPVGRRMSELLSVEPAWCEVLEKIYYTGEPIRTEHPVHELGRWYSTYMSRMGEAGSPLIACIYDDITERKHDEQRKDYLLRLSDALRPLSDTEEIEAIACRLLGRELQVGRAFYSEVCEAENYVRVNQEYLGGDSPSLVGIHPISAYAWIVPLYYQGKPIVIDDVHHGGLIPKEDLPAMEYTQVISFIMIPLIKDNVVVGTLTASEPHPRQWKPQEIKLLEETAERLWESTERAKAEKAVRRSEEQLRLFLTASSNLVYRMSADWSEMYTLNGKNILADTEDPTGDWTAKYIPETHRDLMWSTIHSAIARKAIFELEHQVYQVDGTTGWVLSRAVPLLDKDGDIVEWIAAAIDINARKKAEILLQHFNERLENVVEERTLALDRNRALLQATLNSSQEMIQVFRAVRDRSGKIIDFIWVLNNHTSEIIYGDVIGKSLIKRNPGVVAAGIFERFVAVTETGIPQQYEKNYVQEQFDGWFYQSVVKLNDGIATTTTNITERKKIELQLKQNRDQLQSILDTTLLQMAILEAVRDAQGKIADFRIKLVNQELEKETGRSDLVGKLYATEYPGIRASGIFDLIVKAIETGEPQATEFFYPHEGFNKWFSCMFVKLGDGVVATNMDITGRKRIEEERFKNYLLLQQYEDIAAMGSWDYNLLTKTITWSDGMYRLFGLAKGSPILPEIYLDHSTKKGRDAAERVVRHIRSGDTDFEETVEMSVSGKIKVLHLKATVAKNAQGEAEKVLGVGMDVSAIYAAEEKIRRMEAEQQLEIFRVSLSTLEVERHRISESLHNGIAQVLYGIKINMKSLRPGMEKDRFDSLKEYMNKLLTESIDEVRRISHKMMPTTLEQFGLKSAIMDACEQLSKDTFFNCKISGSQKRLEKYMELAVYRTTQELMTNVIKHAKASQCAVSIDIGYDEIRIRVADNGVGMAEDGQHKPGIGLASIRSKIKLLKGNVMVISSRGKGTAVEVMIPRQERGL